MSAALVMPSMPPPEYDDCEVVTNCMFDAGRPSQFSQWARCPLSQ